MTSPGRVRTITLPVSKNPFYRPPLIANSPAVVHLSAWFSCFSSTFLPSCLSVAKIVVAACDLCGIISQACPSGGMADAVVSKTSVFVTCEFDSRLGHQLFLSRKIHFHMPSRFPSHEIMAQTMRLEKSVARISSRAVMRSAQSHFSGYETIRGCSLQDFQLMKEFASHKLKKCDSALPSVSQPEKTAASNRDNLTRPAPPSAARVRRG